MFVGEQVGGGGGGWGLGRENFKGLFQEGYK